MRDGGGRGGNRQRATALIDTAPAPNPIGWELSRPDSPDWIDKEREKHFQVEEGQKILECKGGFGIERE
jgi:hypothetical protein